MMQSEARPVAPFEDLQPFERQEAEEVFSQESFAVKISRQRQLYCGPMSWVLALCVLGPAVLLCPCDGREVYVAELQSEERQGALEAHAPWEAHADDTWDQDGVLMKPLSRSATAQEIEDTDTSVKST
jgi:hypothetical protein